MEGWLHLRASQDNDRHQVTQDPHAAHQGEKEISEHKSWKCFHCRLFTWAVLSIIHEYCPMFCVLCAMFHIFYSMFFVLCSVFSVPCSMFCVLFFMFYVLCSLTYVLCSMFYVLCSMFYVLCSMFHDIMFYVFWSQMSDWGPQTPCSQFQSSHYLWETGRSFQTWIKHK